MEKKYLVINIIGGPGAGKSTEMAGLFYFLKKRGINCEMATEYVKDKAWEEDYRAMDDQIYIIGKQFHRISRLIDKVDIVIMDTSLLSSIIYDKNKSEALKKLCVEAFNRFNNMVFFIDRGQTAFKTDARYLKLMDELDIPYLKVTNENAIDTIINTLKTTGYIN